MPSFKTYIESIILTIYENHLKTGINKYSIEHLHNLITSNLHLTPPTISNYIKNLVNIGYLKVNAGFELTELLLQKGKELYDKKIATVTQPIIEKKDTDELGFFKY